MSRGRARLGALLVASTLALTAEAHALESSRALLASLRGAGRAEAAVTFAVGDPIAGRPRASLGRLALEPPDRARLDFGASGEAVTLRADGGEWRQPATKQLLRLSPDHAAGALRWWRVLLDPAGRGASERRVGPRHYRLRLDGEPGAGADSADVRLDARGLPAELALGEQQGGAVARFSAWRFMRARGASAFRLTAPPGYADVELP